MPRKKAEPQGNPFEFFEGLKTGNKFADSNKEIETKEFIDTGCYSLNAIISGDMTRGIPNNRITMVAGKEQVGKSFLSAYAFCKPLQDMGYFIYYIDTEGSVTNEDLIAFGFKQGQFKIIQEEVIEEVRFTMTTILNGLEEAMGRSLENKNKCAFVLDSQGQLDTLKSREDSMARKVKADLTFQKELKKLYKNVTGRMARMSIPFFVANHIYEDNMSFITKTVVSGGQGGLYASSVILHLRKKQYKEGTERVGTILTAKLYKSRWCREGKEASFYLNFEKGMNKWYGTHEFALNADLIEELKGVTVDKKTGTFKIPRKYDDLNIPDKYIEIFTGNAKPKLVVIKDPKITSDKWIVCRDTELYKESTIGTIFNEINEWVKQNVKLLKPVDFKYEDDNEDDNIPVEENTNEESVNSEEVST